MHTVVKSEERTRASGYWVGICAKQWLKSRELCQEHLPVPRVDGLVDALHGCKWMTTLHEAETNCLRRLPVDIITVYIIDATCYEKTKCAFPWWDSKLCNSVP